MIYTFRRLCRRNRIFQKGGFRPAIRKAGGGGGGGGGGEGVSAGSLPVYTYKTDNR